MRKKLVVTSLPIPIEHFKLGSLVTDVSKPHIDAHAPITPSSEEIYTAEQNGYKSLVRLYRNTTLKPHLAVLGFDYSKETDNSLVLEATRGLLYELKNPTVWFEKLCGQSKTRKWLQDKNSRREDIFFVTGCRALFDAQMTQKQKHGVTRGGEISVPVDAIAAAAGTGLPISLGLDAGIQASVEKSSTLEQEFSAPGEQVYAVQYRRVKLRLFRSHEADASSLAGKTCWKDVLVQRGGGDSDMVVAETEAALRLGKDISRVADDEGDDEYMVLLE